MSDQIINERGMTELHLACYHGELDWVQNCLEGGLDVHAQDRDGYTPLHWVVDMGLVGNGEEREAIVLALFQAGANPNTRDITGETVFDTARRTDAIYLLDSLGQHKE